MTTVAITGATGILGRALCDVLERDDRVDALVGVARRPFNPAENGLTKMSFRAADVLDQGALVDAFAGADVVVHLAFTVLDRGIHPEQTRLINVEGSLNVFEAAAAVGARKVVYASSIAAYGAWPDNPVPIPESHATRGNPDFYYAQHKAEVEVFLDSFERTHAGMAVVRIRPCIIVGPNSVDLFRGPLPTPLAGLLLSRLVPKAFPDPGISPVQFVHEDDVAQAFRLAILDEKARGAYNVAGAGSIDAFELAQIIGAVRVPIPAGLAKRLIDVAYRARISPTGSPWIDMATYPVIVDTTRARQELGWVPRFDSRTALEDMLDRFREAAPLNRLLA